MDWIYEFYINQMENEVSYQEVDDMDIFGYMDVWAYKAKKDREVAIEEAIRILR